MRQAPKLKYILIIGVVLLIIVLILIFWIHPELGHRFKAKLLYWAQKFWHTLFPGSVINSKPLPQIKPKLFPTS